MYRFSLITLLALLSISAASQDTTRYLHFTSTGGFYGVDTTAIFMRYEDTTPVRIDTVKVVMLCSDTSEYAGEFNTMLVIDGSIELGGIDKHRIPWVYWQFGYRITKHYKHGLWTSSGFMTADKKGLRREIMVWDYKELWGEGRIY